MEKYEIKSLVDKLNYYTKLYDEGHPEITDKEWDDLYFQLQAAESFYNVYYEDSPTQRVNYQVVNELNKVEHNHKMLSLDKTKDIDVVSSFIGKKPYLAMLKMDGLTCSLRYVDGKLVSAETRGNGLVGEDILHNALVVKSIPNKINYTKELIIDGEIICKYDDFKEFEQEYANPRNFASGSIRLLDAAECARRNLTFVAWEVIKGLDEINEFAKKINSLTELGFTVVDNCITNDYNEDIELLKVFAKNHNYPIDGVVFKFNDVQYGKSLGETNHHFKNAIAYKFYDEEYETTLIDLSYDVSRYGILTPVAVFEPIDIEGSTVSRASLSNISVLEDTLGRPYKGQKLWITKRNMIIPKVERAEKLEYDINDEIHILTHCPSCGSELIVKQDNASKVLCCPNENCGCRLINHLEHFCSKNCMDIQGLSKATLEKLIDWGWVSSYIDLYNLENFSNEWKNKAGFGEKSVERILSALETSKTTTLNRVIAAAGIPLIGPGVAKMLGEIYHTWSDFRNETDFEHIDGIGPEMNNALLSFNYNEIDAIIPFLTIENNKVEKNNSLEGLTFCITGHLQLIKNRQILSNMIEEKGGKITSSISSKTSYLINNDINSNSTKNIKAKELNIPIISENEILKMMEVNASE